MKWHDTCGTTSYPSASACLTDMRCETSCRNRHTPPCVLQLVRCSSSASQRGKASPVVAEPFQPRVAWLTPAPTRM